jgi:hypothetical protein
LQIRRRDKIFFLLIAGGVSAPSPACPCGLMSSLRGEERVALQLLHRSPAPGGDTGMSAVRAASCRSRCGAVTRQPRAHHRFPTRAASRRAAPPPSDQTGHPRQCTGRASGSRFRHESLDAAIAPSPRERSKSRSRSRPPRPPCSGCRWTGRRRIRLFRSVRER